MWIAHHKSHASKPWRAKCLVAITASARPTVAMLPLS